MERASIRTSNLLIVRCMTNPKNNDVVSSATFILQHVDRLIMFTDRLALSYMGGLLCQ